ncbi:transposase [Streptomyces sp. NPDC058051]
MRFRVRTGVPWRDVPSEYGPWGRVYDLFCRWQRDGNWHGIFTQLQSQADLKGSITRGLSIDSTVCRAHQHATGPGSGAICRRSRRAVSSLSLVITDWDVRAADLLPSCTWPSSRARN